MSALLLEPENQLVPNRVLLRRVSWDRFEALDQDLDGLGARLAYLDGTLEIMAPISEEHERQKFLIGHLVALYCSHRGIEFWPCGSASLRLAERAANEPDEQFHFHEKKARPDLAIEVIFTSGGISRPALLHSFGIPEVWVWKDSKLQAYQWTESQYVETSTSLVLPGLDLRLMERCAQMCRATEAFAEFLRSL